MFRQTEADPTPTRPSSGPGRARASRATCRQSARRRQRSIRLDHPAERTPSSSLSLQSPSDAPRRALDRRGFSPAEAAGRAPPLRA